MSDTLKIDAVVEIDADDVLEANFLGVGVQVSPYTAYEISEADWTLICQRMGKLGLPLTRVMLDAGWYCRGFDAAGEPVYDWDSRLMRLVYNVLDWCEANHVIVMLGEWGAPSAELGIEMQDRRWSRIVADCVERMLNHRGYTCIAYYNLINEPHGSWSSTAGNWDLWCTVITNLHDEFVARGLDKRIGIGVPDAGGDWTMKSLDNDRIKAVAGIYDEHWYLMHESVQKGGTETMARKQVEAVREKDPGKPFFLGEVGLMDDLDHVKDCQYHVYDFWYGVTMADIAVQVIRAGSAGLIAWNLDDAMHQKHSEYAKPEDDPYDWRKIWGLWNILGASRGKPEERHIRPWFYSWSMLARYFPSGCETIAATESGLEALRVAAAKNADGDRWDLSLAVVNNSDQERTVKLVVPAAAGQLATLSQFEYFDREGKNRVDAWPEVIDANGNDIYPSPTRTLENVDLGEGLVVSLPPKSALCVTTIEEGHALTLS